MTNGLDPITPQLKAAKDLFDAYCSLDIKNVEPLISKDFTFQTFPKIAEHPDEAKDAHFGGYGKLLSSMSKIEVPLQCDSEIAGLYLSPLGYLSRSDRSPGESHPSCSSFHVYPSLHLGS